MSGNQNRRTAAQSVRTSVLLVSVIVAAGKIMGFLREILLAGAFGATDTVDAFLQAESTLTVFLGVLSSFSTVFVPVYQRIRRERGEQSAYAYVWRLLTVLELLTLLCVFVLFLFGGRVMDFSAPGYAPEKRALAVRFFKRLMWAQLLIVPNGILTAYLNCCGRPVASTAGLLLIGTGQLGCTAAAAFAGRPLLLSWVLTAGNLLQFLYLACCAGQTGLRLCRSEAAASAVRESAVLAAPVFLSTMISEVNVFFDRFFASWLSEGALSILFYADRVRILPIYLFTTVLEAVFYPLVSAAADDRAQMGRLTRKGLEWILVLCLPLTVGLITLAEPVMTLIYFRGAFTPDQVHRTALAFSCYALGSLPLVVQALLLRVFYAEQKTRYGTLVGAVSVGGNIVMNALLVRPLGGPGLALGTSFAGFLGCAVCLRLAGGMIDRAAFRGLLPEALRISLASALMGAVIVPLNRMVMSRGGTMLVPAASILVCFAAGVGVYLGAGEALKSEPVRELRRFLFSLVRRRLDRNHQKGA